jgi:hypothetical protein
MLVSIADSLEILSPFSRRRRRRRSFSFILL